MTWIGGKKALREQILIRFPPSYGRYIEVFGGGGWVLFHKPKTEFEVYNDKSANLVNLYRCVRDAPEDLIRELEFSLNSRLNFEHMRQIMKTPGELPDIKRAAYFYEIIRYSYASSMTSYGSVPRGMWGNFPLIRSACARLQKVVIENKDFEHLIRQYDRAESFFYLDPPYFSTENYYEGVGFTASDHERLANTLFGIDGMFLLSYNDCPEIRTLYGKPGIIIESLSRLSNIAQRYEGGKEFAELLISNYDTTERLKTYAQLNLFGTDSAADEIQERKIIYYG
jgi:DNA adenine methylase